jgi:hypothetical protein
MAVYSWRRRPTRHFGEVWVPFAQVDLQGPDGRFQAFAVQVDSGATVSLLRRSVADLLGIDLESGRRVDLTGIGGGRTTAYVHDLPTRIEEKWPPIEVPFAIATVESTPNLLGRLGVFDQLQVDFDVSLRQTTLSAPWLDEADRRVWNFLFEVETSILKRLPGSDLSEPLRKAANKMISRASLLLASAAGLVKLHRHYSAPLLIRALFEVAAQFEYMMQDSETRARQYLDFEHVTRYLRERAFLTKANGPIGDMLRRSPQRKEGEKKVEAEFEKVRPRFLNKKGKIWKNWHGLQFRQLVGRLQSSGVDWQTEYELWWKDFSAWAHADPFGEDRPQRGLADKGSDVLLQCYPYYSRMLLKISEKLILTNEQYQFLKEAARGLA